MAVNRPMTLDERRRRRDQRAAVQTANQIVQDAAISRARTVTVEWACVVLLVVVGTTLTLATFRRGQTPLTFGLGGWWGLLFGGLLSHAVLQRGNRLQLFLLAFFAALPLGAIPTSLWLPEGTNLAVLAFGALAVALLAIAVRWGVELGSTSAATGMTAGTLRQAWAVALANTAKWLHDAILKWLAALLLLVVGGTLIFFGRQNHEDVQLWAGLVVIYLTGSVGWWLPGLRRRTPWRMALRHCGQLCLWLSLLLAPLVEVGPGPNLPYEARPSIRFVAAALGLLAIGLTWFFQRASILSHRSKPERKKTIERVLALVIVALSLLLGLLGANLWQRVRLTVSGTAVTDTDLLGRTQFHPLGDVQSLLIVQPLEGVPVYLTGLVYADMKTFWTSPLLFPGKQFPADQHDIVQATRTAAGLNVQSQVQSRITRWAR